MRIPYKDISIAIIIFDFEVWHTFEKFNISKPKKYDFHIAHGYFLWRDLSHGTIFFLACDLVLAVWLAVEKC